MSALHVISVDEAPLSPARRHLADAIAAKRRCEETFDREKAPAEALQQVITAADQAEAALAALQAARQRLTGEWLAEGRVGDRPVADRDEQRAEDEARRARADADAAGLVLPAALERRRHARAGLDDAAGAVDAAVAAVAFEAAAEMARGKLLPAIEAVLRHEVRLRRLQDALFARGSSPAGNAAERIADLLRRVKSEAAVGRDGAIGSAFLNALGTDPGAQL